jgi:MOSC domain-containing protein YiiM
MKVLSVNVAMVGDLFITQSGTAHRIITGIQLETDVWIGDRLEIGSVLLEVTEPRSPCYKFSAKMGFSHAVRMMVQSGATGFYLCVVREGVLQAGDTISLFPGPREVSITQVNDQRRRGRQRDLF